MAQIFLINGSSSPWTFPTGGVVSGHVVELIGPGGNGAAGTTGTSGVAGGGGGGGGYAKLTYSSGTVTPGTTTFAFVVPAGGAAAKTVWQTATNGQNAGFGGNASGATAGAAGATGALIGSPGVVYTLTANFAGAAGGAGGGAGTLGGGGGGGSAGPHAAGGVGRTPTTTQGGGGGGADNGATGNAASTTGGTGHTGAGGTVANPGGAGTGCSGGGGGTAVQTSVGGLGGSGSEIATGYGPGGGGGGSGAWATNSAPTIRGGTGGSFGGGGGGTGYARGTGGTITVGSGAGGLIAITLVQNYTMAAATGAFAIAGSGTTTVTWDPANKGTDVVLSGGNLSATNAASYESVRGTVSKSTGKWHFEVTATVGGGFTIGIGLANASASMATYLHASTNAIVYYQTGEVYWGGSLLTTLATYTTGDVIYVDWDADASKVWFGKNATNDPTTGGITYSVTGALFPATTILTGAVALAKFAGSTHIPSGYAELGGTFETILTYVGGGAPPTVYAGSWYSDLSQPRLQARTRRHAGEQSFALVPLVTGNAYTLTAGVGAFALAGIDAGLKAPVYWSPTDKDSTVSLSNANRTATKASGTNGNYGNARTNIGFTDKRYFEARVTSQITNGASGVGIGSATSSLSGTGAYIGVDINSIGVYYRSSGGSQVFVNNGVTIFYTLDNATTGDVIRIAIDPVAKKFWAAINGGLWNNQAGDNPATGVCTPDFSSATWAPVQYPFASLSDTTDTIVANFSTASFSYTAPSGFLPINDAVAATPETIYAGSWYQDLSQPRLKGRTRSHAGEASLFFVRAEGVDTAAWFRDLSQSRLKARTRSHAGEQTFALVPFVANAYTLTAGVGAFSLAGQDATANRGFPVSTGAFVLAGQAIAPTVGRPAWYQDLSQPRLKARTRSHTGEQSFAFVPLVAGNAYTLTASVGAFALASPAIGLALSMPASVGAFSVAGQGVALTTITGAWSWYVPLSQPRRPVRSHAGEASVFASPFVANAYTLAAATGAYSLAGQAATLDAGRKIAASTGAFALAGQAVTLATVTGTWSWFHPLSQPRRPVRSHAGEVSAFFVPAETVTAAAWVQPTGQPRLRARTRSHAGEASVFSTPFVRNVYTLTAATGAYVIANPSVTLSTTGSFSLVCATGAFTLAGQAVTLRHGYVPLTAGVATYSLASPSTGLALSFPVSAGAFTVAGQAVTPRIGFPVSTGAFVLSAPDTALSTTHVGAKTLSAATGGFTVAAPAVRLAASHRLVAGTGALAFAGQAVTLARQLRVAAGTGAVALAGQSAALRLGRKIPCATGPFALAGQAARLAASHRLYPTAAAYLLGFPTTHFGRNAVTMVAGVGAFALSGKPVHFRFGKAATGAYVIAGHANLVIRASPSARWLRALADSVGATLSADVATTGSLTALADSVGATLSADVATTGSLAATRSTGVALVAQAGAGDPTLGAVRG